MFEAGTEVGFSVVVWSWIVEHSIALMALVQPWIYWAWRKYAKRGSIEIHETSNVEVGYSGFGPTIGLFGTLRAVNEDQFVRSIELCITRSTDHQRLIFEWAALRPNTFAIGAPSDTKFELASGFMLLQSQPQKYNIFFLNTDLQNRANQHVQGIRESFVSFCNDERARDVITGSTEQEIASAYGRFTQQPGHLRAFTELDHLFDWQDVEYQLEMRVNTANPNRTFSHLWRFRLTTQDIQNLRLNVIRICEESCRGQSETPYHFAYCPYSPDEHPRLAAAARA